MIITCPTLQQLLVLINHFRDCYSFLNGLSLCQGIATLSPPHTDSRMQVPSELWLRKETSATPFIKTQGSFGNNPHKARHCTELPFGRCSCVQQNRVPGKEVTSTLWHEYFQKSHISGLRFFGVAGVSPSGLWWSWLCLFLGISVVPWSLQPFWRFSELPNIF